MAQGKQVACDELTSYMFGELTADAESAFTHHLQTCGECKEVLSGLSQINQRLLFPPTDEEVTLSPDLKSRTLARAFAARVPLVPDNHHTYFTSKHKKSYLKWLGGALIPVALLSLGVVLGRISLAPARNEIVQPAQMMSEVSFQPTSSFSQASGMAMVYKKGPTLNIVVYVKHLHPNDTYGCYSVWELNKTTKRNLGDFIVNKNGDAVISMVIPHSIESNKICISLEPTWNDPVPKGPYVLVPSTYQS